MPHPRPLVRFRLGTQMSRRKRILLIDDNSHDRELTAALLTQGLPDVSILSISDPVTLGECLVARDFSAVVLERQLKWYDSLQLLRKIRDKNPQCFLILYANEPLVSLSPDLAELRLTAYFTKESKDLLQIPKALRQAFSQESGLAIAEDGTPTSETSRSNDKRSLEHHSKEDDFSQMVYAISHDLQEPLQIFSRQTSLLDEHYMQQLDDNGQSLITNMGRVARHMQSMLDALLDYYRIDNPLAEIEKIDVSQSIKAVLSMLDSALQEIGASVEIGKLPHLYLNKGQMIQLFQNLLGNAMKFRGKQPLNIKIEAQNTSLAWLFSVRDNGIGIEKDALDRIFNMFQRLHTQEEYPGNGMGLALCKRIIEQHGGKIWARSKPNRGTIIYFTIPKQPANLISQPDVVTEIQK